MNSHPVIVLGMHRSGTSFLASLVRALGVDMGERMLEADSGNRRGYFEDVEVLAFHDRLLRSRLPASEARGAFLVPADFRFEPTPEELEEARSLVESRSACNGLWGWKDPRCCLFLDMWARILPDAKYVAVYRNPLEVYYSFLKRKDWAALLAPEAIFDSYAVYNRAILRVRDSAPERFMVLNAKKAFASLPALADALGGFLGVPLPDFSALPEFAGGEFSSLGTVAEQYRLMSAVYPQAAAAFEAMQKCVQDPECFEEGCGAVFPSSLTAALAEGAEALSASGGNCAGLHGLVDSVCLNVSPEKLSEIKRDIASALDAAYERLRGERDRYIDLYEKFFPLYENYFKAWEGAVQTLDGTRRWIASDLMPRALSVDPSPGRIRQAAELARTLLDRECGPITKDNAAERHSLLPRDELVFDQVFRPSGWKPALGATSPQEQLYAEWAARNVDLSKGSVVDLGSWLGSFSIAIARGLLANPTAKTRLDAGEKIIEAFDIFNWHEGFDHWVRGTVHEGKYRRGDDFRDAFLHEVREFSGLVNVNKADLSNWNWAGGEIPFLVNDTWKTLKIAACTVRTFFPSMRPGSILLNQDYLWCTESFIHVCMYRLRRYFEPVYQVPNSTTVVFACRETPADAPAMPMHFEDISPDEIDEAFRWSATFVDDIARQALPLAQAWLLAKCGAFDRARSLAKGVLGTRDINHGFIRWEIEGLKSMDYGFLFE